ncbi:GMC oxidoreductase [Bisporella sp. PMI_857]|nr:GMC oxidoreductase [Bisporella sp. PMI_857]
MDSHTSREGISGILALAVATTGMHTEISSNITEVDIIIAGGETAGCIIASRLAEADPDLSILIIEQGLNNFNVQSVIYPALFERNTMPGSDTALFWKANKSPGQWDEFDSWNTAGWTAGDVLPYLKAETYHGETSNISTHVYQGPVNVSKGTHQAPQAEDAFIEGAIKVGIPEIIDLQSLHSNDGSGPCNFPNLYVLVSNQVVRILFDETKRAIGVEYRAKRNSTEQTKEIRTVAVKKLVIASAGAFGTPLLLKRSRPGNPAVLERARVPVLESLPGVGDEFQDHHFVGYVYRTSLSPNKTLKGIARNDRDRDVEAMISRNDPQLGWNGHDASSKLRPSYSEAAALGPEFQTRWERDFKDAPNCPLMVMGLFNYYFGDPAALPDDAEYATIAPWVAYPYARGHVHITGPGIDDPYDFDPRRLLDEDDIDLKSHVWGYKEQREIARKMDIFRGELASGQPRFPEGSNAAVIEIADGPIFEEIEYSAEDDAAIVHYVRENLGTSRHPLGTCKMAPRGENGVVDPNLNVYGISGLKLADLSVPPQIVAANTYNTALMFGEKAADIIVHELGLAQL